MKKGVKYQFVFTTCHQIAHEAYSRNAYAPDKSSTNHNE